MNENYKQEAEQAILRHADRIESGDLQWVGGTPDYEGEACVGWCLLAGSMDRLSSIRGKRMRYDGDDDPIYVALNLEAAARGTLHFTNWNDEKCESAAEAVDFLRHAAKRVWEGE